jgi:hypothetical protein
LLEKSSEGLSEALDPERLIREADVLSVIRHVSKVPTSRPSLSHLGDGREAQFAISWLVVEQLVCNFRMVVCERLFG